MSTSHTPDTTFTNADLEQLEHLANAATTGQWKKRSHPVLPSFIEAPRCNPEDPYDIELLGEDTTLYPTREADIDYIVGLQPEVVRKLIRELRAAREASATRA